ncbi:MAG: glycosyltransferase family 4 protein [Dysgonamonadaceae bacterium]|jgi:glycosyltransferase involved in cell wall biosynthesis|nr:glycosyltransferase family 4 protein [Dysgonamonadaceae bacterium]
MGRTVNPKILYLLPGGLFNPAGMERVITIKAGYLAEKLNYDVSIVTTEQMGRPVFYPLSGKVHLYHLDTGIYARFGKESYAEKVVSRFFKTLKYKRELTRLLPEIRPDITVSTLGLDIGFLNSLKDGSIKLGELHFPGNFRSLTAGKLSGGSIPNWVAKLRTEELKRKCAQLKRLVVLTEEEKSFWENSRNIEIIPNPLPFYYETEAELTGKKALAAGRLVYEKGFDMLIEAWGIVAERHPGWELSIFGDGERKASLLRLIDEKGLSGAVKIHEPVADIQHVYPEYSIFVFTSRYLDALPMVLLEAMSFGLPVAAFDAPCGPKDLIRDGVNGFLVKTGDIQGLACKIINLIEASGLRKSMGKASKAFSSDFRVEKIMGRWDKLFTELINEKNSSIGN